MKTIELHGRWLDEALDWLGVRKYERGWTKIRSILEDARSRSFIGLGLLLQILPSVDLVRIEYEVRYRRPDRLQR